MLVISSLKVNIQIKLINWNFFRCTLCEDDFNQIQGLQRDRDL